MPAAETNHEPEAGDYYAETYYVTDLIEDKARSGRMHKLNKIKQQQQRRDDKVAELEAQLAKVTLTVKLQAEVRLSLVAPEGTGTTQPVASVLYVA
jgi:hypothetical protein